MMIRRVVGLVCLGCVASGLAACGGDDGDGAGPKSVDTTNSAVDGCDALKLAPPEPGTGIQVSVDMQLGVGEERQVCKLVLAGADVNLNWTEGTFTRGSHHANIASTTYKDQLPTQDITGQTVDASQAADCETLGSNWSVRGLISTRGSADGSGLTKGVLPDDVALKIAKNDVLELNFHMINLGKKPLHACYKENLYGIADNQMKQQAGVLFWYDNYITVPANGESSASMACPISQPMNLVQQASHMHRRGVDYRAALLDGDPLFGGNEVQELYTTTTWDEPAPRVNTPPLALEPGQWIKWSCGYQNRESRNVAQGQQTTDEMCMFVGLYWPQNPLLDWCMSPKLLTAYSAGRPFGTGTMNGAQYSDCWAKSAGNAALTGGGPASADARYAAQRCVTESCPKVSAQVNDALAGDVDISKVTCD